MSSNQNPQNNDSEKSNSSKLIAGITALLVALGGVIYAVNRTFQFGNVVFVFNLQGITNVFNPHSPSPNATPTITPPPPNLSEDIETSAKKAEVLYNNSNYIEALKVLNNILLRPDLSKYPCIGCLYAYKGSCHEKLGQKQDALNAYSIAKNRGEAVNMATSGIDRLTKN